MRENPYKSVADHVDVMQRGQPDIVFAALATSLAAGVLLTFPLMITLFVFFAADLVMFLAFVLQRRPRAALLAALAAILVYWSYHNTLWGFSSNRPTLRVAWGWLICACAAQFSLTSLPAWRGLVDRTDT